MSVERLKAIVLFVLNEVPGKCLGKHELFKILYFASQKHLIRYGDVMIDDFFAFKYGPVPSALFNYLKNGKNAIVSSINIDEEARYILSPVEEPDLDELSLTEIKCLKESINENYGLTFFELSSKSHDIAWSKAWNNPIGKRGTKMNIIDIAKAAGSDEKTIEYIQEELELEAALR